MRVYAVTDTTLAGRRRVGLCCRCDECGHEIEGNDAKEAKAKEGFFKRRKVLLHDVCAEVAGMVAL